MSFPFPFLDLEVKPMNPSISDYKSKRDMAELKRRERQKRFEELTKNLSKEDLGILKFGFRGML